MSDTKFCVRTLDGYLSGVVAVSGEIREFSANVKLLEVGGSRDSIKVALEGLFTSEIKFLEFENLPGGLTDLELKIQPYLLHNAIGINNPKYLKALIDRRKYLSFRVMDLIDEVLNGNLETKVYKMTATFEASESTSIFFCISFGNQTLVLQFLSNNPKNPFQID